MSGLSKDGEMAGIGLPTIRSGDGYYSDLDQGWSEYVDARNELRRKEFQIRRTEFFDSIYAALKAAEEEDHNPIDYMLEGIKEEFDKLLEGRNDIN